MANEVRYSDPYLADLEAAIDNLWLASSMAAHRFAEEHDQRIAELRAFPRLGEPQSRGRFSLPVARSGYRIVYEVNGETVVLLRLIKFAGCVSDNPPNPLCSTTLSNI